MNADATNTPKGMMDCDRVARDEVIEGYLTASLSDADRDAFEEHYFECTRCFNELRTLQIVRGELGRKRVEIEAGASRPFPGWARAAGLAAAVLLAVGVVLWLRPQLPSRDSDLATIQPAARTQSSDEPQPDGPAPTVAPEPSLEQLARVDPPPYQPLTLRSTPDATTARFHRGMERYRNADYAGAVADLSAAAELDPDAAHVRFFLGIADLMLGRDEAAIDELRATIALGDSAYLEEAHFYLAKAFLRRKDLQAAETQLNRVVQLGGTGSDEARRLLTELERREE